MTDQSHDERSPHQSAPSPAPLRRGVAAVVVRSGRLLAIRRSSTVAAPRAICFPGGGIEAGESEAEALCREMQEELGVDVEPVERIWRSFTAWRIDLAWWLARIAPSAQLTPNPAEVESAHWLLPGELRAMPGLLGSNLDFLDAIDRGEVRIEGVESPPAE